MKVLLLIAHGSRKSSANDEIITLANHIESRGRFDAVVAAFVEIAEPDIHAAVDRCVELGATEIIAVPYFLAAGKHVARDIPSELSCVMAKYPDLDIRISPHIGESDVMIDLVIKCAQDPVRNGS